MNRVSAAESEFRPGALSSHIDYLDLIKPDSSIGLIDADLLDNGTRHPNLVLMKISGYCKDLGCFVELIEDYKTTENYDCVFVSRVFTFTHVPTDLEERENVYVGGTGFFPDGGRPLPYEIEHHKPDYDLYLDYVNERIAEGKSRSWFADYLDYSIGFSTRGCFRKCSFCVNQKYSRAFAHSPISEFLDSSRPYIYLWDDNFLAFSGWESILDELEATGKAFQFRQGLDVRLLNEKRAARLSKVKYCGDFIFAFDHIEDRDLIESRLRLWRRYASKGTRLYVLCAFDSQDEKDIVSVFERIKILMRYGCLPYIMRYESYKNSRWRNLYVNIARWCNQPQFFKKKSFRDFCESNQLYHKNKKTKCAALRSMQEFEKVFPEIAAEYFDLRYEDENMMYRYGRPFFGDPSDETCEAQQEAWKRFSEGEPDEKALEDYYSKRLDIVWLERFLPEEAVELSERLFDLINGVTFDEALKAAARSECDEFITAENIPQFSSLEDVSRVPSVLVGVDDFLRYEDLGVMLSGGARKDILADKKYGENHGKMASMLDLASIEKSSSVKGFSSTLFSDLFSQMKQEDKRALMAKLSLRVPVIRSILRAAIDGPTRVQDHMVILADSTLKRRRPNVEALVEGLKDYAKSDETKAVLKNVTK